MSFTFDPSWRASARLAVMLVFALASLAGSAAAQQVKKKQIDAIKASCRSDYMSNCFGVTPGGKEALQCLQQHVAKLSPACKTAVSATMAPPPAAAAPPPAAARPKPAATTAPSPKPAASNQKDAMRAACSGDYLAHCSSTPPGGKAALVCLQRHVKELSAACKRVVSATMPPPRQASKPVASHASTARMDALNKACGNDYLAHCANVPPGGREAVVCLRQNAMALSIPCKRVLSKMTPATRPPPKRAVRAAPPPAAAPPPPAPAAAMPTPKQLKALKFTCRRDFRVHCRGVPPGGQAAFACLAQNSRRLTPNCRTSVRAIELSMPAAPPPAAAAPPPTPVVPVAKIKRMRLRERLMIARACEREKDVVCPAVRPGGGRLVICLASHPQNLSPRCGGALKRALY